jgi:hypothetical protein
MVDNLQKTTAGFYLLKGTKKQEAVSKMIWNTTNTKKTLRT